jgi:hypothetical protein
MKLHPSAFTFLPLILKVLYASCWCPGARAMDVDLRLASAMVPLTSAPVSPSYVSLMVEWTRIRDVFSLGKPAIVPSNFTQDKLNMISLKVCV